tara:strand:+ start:3947 stop:4615 length:669 start_codon:yes stop_codon:yes gene_type:complete
MIRRKDSLGFVEFMRGKYNLYSPQYMINIFNEMTNHEKQRIKTLTFDELWNDLWGKDIGIQYRNEEKISKEKYNKLREGYYGLNNQFYNLDYYLENSNNKWEEAEWGFPKGRRNYQEKDLDCALREFEEETGYNKNEINIVQNVLPYEEIFIGSNMKCYKHKYYLALINNNNIKSHGFQESEVSCMLWMNYIDGMNKIRNYNLEKKKILENINSILQEYSLY